MEMTLAPDPRQTDGTTTEARVRAAALACLARWGLGKTTLDDIATEAGLSRATIYRAFPGGKDTLLDSVLASEVSRFFHALADELDPIDDLEELLVVGLGSAMRFLAGHDALRTVLEREPHLVLPRFTSEGLAPLLEIAAVFAVPYLRRHVDSDEVAASAADLLARLVLSYSLQPSPHLDPDDPASLRSFVRVHLLPGLAPSDNQGTPT